MLGVSLRVCCDALGVPKVESGKSEPPRNPKGDEEERQVIESKGS